MQVINNQSSIILICIIVDGFVGNEWILMKITHTKHLIKVSKIIIN